MKLNYHLGAMSKLLDREFVDYSYKLGKCIKLYSSLKQSVAFFSSDVADTFKKIEEKLISKANKLVKK